MTTSRVYPPHRGNAKRRKSIFHTGILMLEDAERAPEYLRLTIDSDPDEPDEVEVNRSDSEEDVVVLGEKRPTYQEITLEEDDEGEVNEKVVEKEKQEPLPKTAEEPLYECTFCDKSFRVESLLKFHIKMHNTSKPVISESSSSMTIPLNDEEKAVDNKSKKKRHSVENESKVKTNSKSPHRHRTRQEKHRSYKHKKHKRSIST